MRRLISTACIAALAAACAKAPPPRPAASPEAMRAATPAPRATVARPDLAARLSALASDADPEVIRLAVEARRCAIRLDRGGAGDRLAVIDYTQPSTRRRLWVFDMEHERLLYREYVAHGRRSGGDMAQVFSNANGSLASSLGVFRTAETYRGENGYSLRLDGLEPGFNDAARARSIVMHGAWYVDPVQAQRQGRLGRSLGCPALRPQVAQPLIDSIKQGQLLFAYFPDRDWLARSHYLHCG